MPEQTSFFRRRRKALIAAAVIVVIALIVIGNLQSRREKTVAVTVQKIERRDLTSMVSASGEIRPKKNVDVSAQVPGRILRIGVEEGQTVESGDFLMKLDSTQYEANADRDRAVIQSARSQLVQAEAQLQRDRRALERQRQLFDEELISRDQLESAEVLFEISEAHAEAIRSQIRQAEASLKSTLDNIDKTTYASPIAGVITSLRVEEGEVAIIGTMNNPGTVLMTIADLSVMEVEVEVDETDVVNTSLGQTAEVRVDAFPEIKFAGRVTEIGSSALQRTGTGTVQESRDFKVVITLDDPGRKLKPGLSATADIITAKRTGVLTAPISALVVREKPKATDETGAGPAQEEEGVYVVADGRAEFRPVVKGIMGGMDVEIVSGVEEGAEIVAGPYDALRELKDGVLLRPDRRPDRKPA